MKPTFTLTVGSRNIPIHREKFPAGESLIRLGSEIESMWPVSKCLLDFHFKDNGDLFDLALIVDAIRRQLGHDIEIALNMPYLPYARQDRVCNPGESLSVKVMCDFINSLKFTHVLCQNVHSNVGEALLNNLTHIDYEHQIYRVAYAISGARFEDIVLVSPDSGALKKVLHIAKKFKFLHVVQADKERNVLTGELTGFKVHTQTHYGNKDFLIVDDIGDGMGTFIGLAKELRKLTDGKIYLYVTHGIFSKGADILEGVIDRVFVSNLMGQPHELIRELE